MERSVQVRFRLICGILMACMYVCSRVVIMHHQFFGTSEYVESLRLIICSMVKETFLGYMTSLVSMLTLDRWVATKAWAWYESGADSTLLFFAFQECILLFISLTISSFLVWDYITSIQSVYCFGALVLVGTVLFVLVYRRNLREIRELRRGAVINQYSISRTYQIKENISSFTKLSRPMIIVCLPPMAFYPIFALVPQNIGYDGLRFFSVAMYDLWLAIASLTVISCVPYLFPHVMRTLNNLIFARRKRIGLAKPPIESMKKLEKNWRLGLQF
ncbi:hypothetical protein PENTCL1PPCAC_14284 [Pristionchus entomophagus]|uniref:G protein-coupled receptor n=1 Tax=Pristionchus entomophagus TaxID=358040 RepID=A0AAV5TFH8_9BILA|nr:hypothetical protein PENTCL1PPCAC_14284 [Pristionchus entomophagus]